MCTISQRTFKCYMDAPEGFEDLRTFQTFSEVIEMPEEFIQGMQDKAKGPIIFKTI